MKKSLIFVGLLALGFANAQEGNVGINTDQPKATLDIQPSVTNLAGTTNEGILAPRLSKTRIANIEASKLTEGTLVYATDAIYTIGADTAKNGRVAKINEKGYYFYNGTEWVKAGQGQNQSEFPWIYNTDGNVELNHQNSNYKAIYTDKKYTFRNFEGEYEYYSMGTDNGKSVVSGEFVVGNHTQSSYLKASKTENDPTLPITRNAMFMVGVDADTPDNVKSLEGIMSQVITESNNTKDYTNIRGSHSNASHNGTGTVQSLSGIIGLTTTLPNAKTTNQYGGFAQAIQYSDHDSQTIVGMKGNAGQRGSGVIANLTGVEGEIEARHVTSTGNITNATGILANLNFSTNRYTGSIENLAGVKITQTIASGALSDRITNNYGLYVGDVIRGVNPYSIYTEAGKVRVGDLADTSATADRTVVVDKDGVLKVGSAATTTATNGVQNTTDMKCEEATRGVMNFVKDVTIGSGTGDAFAICLKGTDGKFYWRYLYGAGGVSNLEGSFGSGLQ